MIALLLFVILGAAFAAEPENNSFFSRRSDAFSSHC